MPSLFVLTFTGRYYNQQIINNFNYVVENADSTQFDKNIGSMIVDAIGARDIDTGTFAAGSLMAAWQNLASAGYVFESLYVREPYPEGIFFEYVFPDDPQGNAPGTTSAASTLAFGLRSVRKRKDIRRAFKRIVGVNQEDYTINNALTTNALNRVQVFGAEASAQLTLLDTAGNQTTASPVMVKKQRNVSPDGKVTYDYFSDPNIQVSNTAVIEAWEAYTNVRTQVSRQVGRGK